MSEISWLVVVFIFSWLTTLTLLLLKKRSAPKASSFEVSTDSQFSYGLVKFNPFSDTGGEQSFVISLLDRHASGIIITSLHGRGITRLYAKKITSGSAEQELSAEEKQALSIALKK